MLLEPAAGLEHLLGVDLDVGRLALEAAEGWWMSSRALGSASRLPSAPPMTTSEPADMATPKQMVCTSRRDVLHRVVDGQAGA